MSNAVNYHGPGNREDAHNLDTAAHAALIAGFASVADISGPEIIVPPGSSLAASASAAWGSANLAIFNRFHVPYRKAYRWSQFRIGVQSGNIQTGVVSLARTGTTVNATRVMDSGIIASPAAGGARIDLGATTLAPGDYALFLWADNTTFAVHQGIDNAVINSRFQFSASPAGGVPATVLTIGVSNRWIAGLTLESDS